MTTPDLSGTFKRMCVIENNPTGNGIKLTAFGNDGKPLVTGEGFKVNNFWAVTDFTAKFVENIADMVGSGGKVIGDSTALNRPQFGATGMENGIKVDLAKGTCDVSTVDAGGVPEGTMRFGVHLRGAPFSATPK